VLDVTRKRGKGKLRRGEEKRSGEKTLGEVESLLHVKVARYLVK
jgi:hypothetical protein